jgi:hypothetical protein
VKLAIVILTVCCICEGILAVYLAAKLFYERQFIARELESLLDDVEAECDRASKFLREKDNGRGSRDAQSDDASV